MKILICSILAVAAFYTDVCYAAEAYVAECYFVVDKKAVDIYVNENTGPGSYYSKLAQALSNIRTDIDYTITEANQLLSTLNVNGLNVQISARSVNILNADLFPAIYLENGNRILDVSALRLYSDWLISQGAYSALKYDCAFLWTGYDLVGGAGISATAYGNIGKICDPKLSLAVIEFNATYITALSTAQQLALQLGSSFDGIASDQIMAISNDPADKRRWFFSQCTASDIKEFLPLLTPNCLLDTNATSTRPATSWATYNGRIFDQNVICQRTLNDTRTYACLSSNLYNDLSPKGDTICQQIYCQIPGTIFCIPTFTPEGIICDNKKRCDNGKCVADTSAASANVDGECVWGDQKVLNLASFPFNGTCQQFINQEGQLMCYNSIISNLCCATCKRYRTAMPDCLYGDKNNVCPGLPRSTACATNNAAICCSTCRGAVGKRSTGEDRGGYIIKDDSHSDAHKIDGFKAKKHYSSK